MAEHGLIVGGVGRFGRAVEVGGYGDFAGEADYFGEGDKGVVPAEFDYRGVAAALGASGGEGCRGQWQLKFCRFFPAFRVADEAGPSDGAVRGEVFGVVGGLFGLEDEYLDGGAGEVFAEAQAGVYDAGVVVDEHCVGGQQSGQVAESHCRGLVAAARDQQQAFVAVGQGMAGYAVVGEGIVEVVDADVAYVWEGLIHEAGCYFRQKPFVNSMSTVKISSRPVSMIRLSTHCPRGGTRSQPPP